MTNGLKISKSALKEQLHFENVYASVNLIGMLYTLGIPVTISSHNTG
jgi:hypothetical protein